MAGKSTKSAPASEPVVRTSQPLRFLSSKPLLWATLLVAAASLRIVSTYSHFCFTADEPGHFGCGLEYVASHVYRLETQHPPLARAAMALLPYLDGSRPAGNSKPDKEGMAVMYRRGNPQRTLTLMRLGILPFFILAGFVVFWWARHTFGDATAVIAVALFSMEPSILAHAGLATTDMVFTTFLGAAFLSMILWAEKPDIRRSLLFGAASGLMVLSKFTAVLYFPAAAGVALLTFAGVHRPGWRQLAVLARARASGLALAVGTGALVVWAGYFFSFGRIPGTPIYAPAPELFDGIASVLRHNSTGHTAFLFGQVSRTGWWYYFPAVLVLKTPLAFLILLAAGAWFCARRRNVDSLLPLAFSLGILLPAMAGQINIGVRHVLPLYLAFSVIAAVAVVRLVESTGAWKTAAATTAMLWLAATGILHHPYYLAYLNETVQVEPEKVITDSDLDWGQDYVEVASRLRQLGVNEVTFGTDPWLNHYFQMWPGFPAIKPVRAMYPSEGWTVISPTADKTSQYGLNYRYPKLKPWFDTIEPTERIGTILLYYVPPGAIRMKAPEQHP